MTASTRIAPVPLPRTLVAVEPDMAAVLRAKSEAERLRIGWGMWDAAQDMLTRLLTAEHTDWSPAEVGREVARRLSHAADVR